MVGTKVRIGKHLICLRCNHKWLPRQETITICPKCKSPYWNSPRKVGVENNEKERTRKNKRKSIS